MKSIKQNFFSYMVDHALMCDTKWCICKASTFQDTMCHIRDMTNDDYEIKCINEALDNCGNVKNG